MKMPFFILLVIACNISAELKSFTEKYCYSCHSNKKSKGGINFESTLKGTDYFDIIDQLNTGEMPPKKSLQPKLEEKQRVIKELEEIIAAQHSKQSGFRWMMKGEHEKVIRHFFKLDDFESQLPVRSRNEFNMPDSDYDNQVLSERYLQDLIESNKLALDEVYPDKIEQDRIWTFDESRDFTILHGAPFSHDFKEGVFSMKIFGPYLKWRAPRSANYRLTFDLDRINPEKAFMKGADVFRIEGRDDTKNYPPRVVYKDLKPSSAQKRVSVDIFLEKGLRMFINTAHDIQGNGRNYKDKLDRDGSYKKSIIEAAGYKISNVKIQAAAKSYPKWAQIFKYPLKDLEKNLEYFADSLSGSGNIELLLKVYNETYEKTQDLNLSYKASLLALMNDHRFILIDDWKSGAVPAAKRAIRAISGLPAKSSQVEDLLIGKRDKRVVLESLLKNNDFWIKGFVNDWLNIDQLEEIDFHNFKKPDAIRYGQSLRDSFHAQFKFLFTTNASINKLFNSEYIFVGLSTVSRNKDLSQAYNKIKDRGGNIVKIAAPISRKAGILTHPAFLAASGNGEEQTNPIVRAAWVYKRILGRIPPEPDLAVSAIEPDVSGIINIRDIIAKHKDQKSCYECHKKFDGLGFMLENYTSIGSYRSHYLKDKVVTEKDKRGRKKTKTVKVNGMKIDPGGTFFGGNIEDLYSFRDYLLKDGKQQFKRTLCERLAEYFLKRSLNIKEKLLIKNEYSSYSDNLLQLTIDILDSKLIRAE